MKYIDFNFKKFDILFYVAILFLVTAHIFHIAGCNEYLLIFQILFIISYISFMIAEYRKNKKINIVTLIVRLSIILMAGLVFIKN